MTIMTMLSMKAEMNIMMRMIMTMMRVASCLMSVSMRSGDGESLVTPGPRVRLSLPSLITSSELDIMCNVKA